ncbi:MAG: S41 family peptidase [Chloroflexi bacterium]|nr:S41 family peptidase [Chloroflexota bacterium]
MHNNSQKSGGFTRSILLGLAIGTGLALVFAAGFFFRDLVGLSMPVGAATAASQDYPLLSEIQGLLDRHYLREQPSPTEREYAAIRGMLATLADPYTFFIDPPVAASESDVLAGTYGGIGVQLQRSEAGELVLFPFEGSPAQSAGIEEGDILQAINGERVDLSLPQDALDQMLRGEVADGNGVEITVTKARDTAELTIFIPFDVINIPSVVWRVLQEDERLGYVQIMRFTGRTPDELTTGLAELRASGVGALVVDLRDNTGGLLQESIQVADEFVDAGVLVYEQDNQGETVFNGDAGGGAVDLPLVVLVNGRTASGAELVAGAIQDRGRGILIGQTTFGKGTVQEIHPLSDQSSLHVTSSEWFTPSQQSFDSSGLQPDIPMIPDESGRDVELGEGVRYLQEQLQLASIQDE